MKYADTADGWREHHGINRDDLGRERFAGRVVSGLRKRFYQMLPASWLIAAFNGSTNEAVVARHGPVEIRRSAACIVAQTCVKGELDTARETALRRLVRYTTSDYRTPVSHCAMRPVMQQEQAPGRWLVRVGLPVIDGVCVMPAGGSRKIRTVSLDAEFLAVTRVAGRPNPRSLARGLAQIATAIAETEWQQSGATMIRHDVPLLPFGIGSSFEIAVPVSRV